MIRSLEARCRLRAAGTAVGLVALFVVGGLATTVSPAGWHTVTLAVLTMLAVASAAVLTGAHLTVPRSRGAVAERLLDAGFLGAVAALVGLLVLGGLALLVLATDAGSAALTTWFVAVVAGGPVVLGAQGRREVRSGGGAARVH